MKITLNSSILLKKLQLLGGVINSSNTLPILDNFLFDVKNNELKITASDLETTMATTLEVESSDTIDNVKQKIQSASKPESTS